MMVAVIFHMVFDLIYVRGEGWGERLWERD
jgi:hypothetical protein